MVDKPAIPPLGAVLMGAIQDRGAAEAAKLSALVGICNKLDTALDVLEKILAVLEAREERERR